VTRADADRRRDSAEGYRRAIGVLEACATDDGFVAAPVDEANYRRVWGRDGGMLAIAALLTGRDDLLECARRTIATLAAHQGPHGEIPSNVDPVGGRISYGGTTGRLDANLWFVIACGEIWQATADDGFLREHLDTLERVRFVLGAWEYNTRGLLYVPQTGDWADEYLQHGYVLYDQLLYLQAQRVLAVVHRHFHGHADHQLEERMRRLCRLIRTNYWFEGDEELDEDDEVYHEVLYRKGREVAPHCRGRHWLPFFSPTGYGYRLDVLANVLASLLGVADEERRRAVDASLDEVVPEELPLLPAFHPVIEPVDDDWEDLQMSFSYAFKNRPYEYHNGGLWPMISGFYVADLAARGELDRAGRFLDGLDRANALPLDGDRWSFPEFVHGRDLEAGGTRCQGWSAGAAVIGHAAVDGETVLRIGPESLR